MFSNKVFSDECLGISIYRDLDCYVVYDDKYDDAIVLDHYPDDDEINDFLNYIREEEPEHV